MGQTRPVTAIKLMINDSVEQKLHALQKKKANLANISINKLSRKELMAQKVRPSLLVLSVQTKEGANADGVDRLKS